MSFNLSIFSMSKTDKLRDFFYGLPKVLVAELGIETETFAVVIRPPFQPYAYVSVLNLFANICY